MEGQLKQNTRRIIMKQYIVDAFTDKVFSGNPAAICILDEWVSEKLMIPAATGNVSIDKTGACWHASATDSTYSFGQSP